MRVSLILGFAAIILIAAAHPRAMPAAAQSVDFANVHEAMRKSLVYVTAEGYDERGVPIENQATGTIINQSGVVMTVHHVLDGLDKAVDGSLKIAGRVGSKYGFPTPLAVLREYPQYDLLLLMFPDVGAKLTPACLDLNGSLHEDAPIGTSGFPAAIDYTADDGTLAGKFGPPGRPGLWRADDMPFNRGQSGSPVYDAAGKVVGIAVGAITNAEGLYYFQPLDAAASIVRDVASCLNGQAETGGTVAPDDTLSAEVEACIATEFDVRRQRAFSREGGVRCPGGGCLLRSSDCNRREGELRYDAAPGYTLEQFSYRPISDNYASNGPLQTIRDGAAVTALSILLRCAPPSQPGAAGGWSQGALEGVERHLDVRSLRAQIEEECIARDP